MTGQHRDRARRLHGAIRRALLTEWDPIGVAGVAEAQDEYDSYVPTIYKLLITQKPGSELVKYLRWLETEQMGLAGDRQATERFAHRLIEIYARLDSEE